MKKCILTAYDNAVCCQGLSELIDNKKEYSERYSWDFICKTDDSFDKEKPAAFSKIKFILDYLYKYDTILWVDMDCVFTNFNIDISKSMEEYEYIGALDEKVNYFCTGNILIRSNDFTKKFFSSLQTLESWFDHTWPWEQRCFNEQALLIGYRNIKKFKDNEFGSFLWSLKKPWQQGDFILHLSGARDDISWQNRVDKFLKYKNKIIK
jgi:galactosyl transferase GMA12/MNN10 family